MHSCRHSSSTLLIPPTIFPFMYTRASCRCALYQPPHIYVYVFIYYTEFRWRYMCKAIVRIYVYVQSSSTVWPSQRIRGSRECRRQRQVHAGDGKAMASQRAPYTTHTRCADEHWRKQQNISNILNGRWRRIYTHRSLVYQ